MKLTIDSFHQGRKIFNFEDIAQLTNDTHACIKYGGKNSEDFKHVSRGADKNDKRGAL